MKKYILRVGSLVHYFKSWENGQDKAIACCVLSCYSTTHAAPMLVKCTGECRGAKAAQARYKRKIERLKKIGKDPGLLDDWRNTSYVCGCREE